MMSLRGAIFAPFPNPRTVDVEEKWDGHQRRTEKAEQRHSPRYPKTVKLECQPGGL